MRSGFTLLEVVISVLLLEVAVVAAVGTCVVAARSLREAEHVERAVLEAEGVLDSLAGVAGPVDGSRPYAGGVVEWSLDSAGAIDLRVVAPDGDVRLALSSGLPLP